MFMVLYIQVSLEGDYLFLMKSVQYTLNNKKQIEYLLSEHYLFQLNDNLSLKERILYHLNLFLLFFHVEKVY